MIELLRLDERLIHGKVATSWAKSLPVDSIMVIDDDVSKDPFSMKSLQMAAASIQNRKTFIRNYDEAMKILTDPRCKDRHIFVVVRQLNTLLKLVENAPDIKEVNMGNYGQMMHSDTPRTKWFNELRFNDDELKIAKEITEKCTVPCWFQDIPGQQKVDLKGYFK